MAVLTTKTDTNSDWLLGDEIIRMRQWGTDRTFPLPSTREAECEIGTSNECSLQLDDERVSRRHARLTRADGIWSIVDLGSKNGLRQDGARQSEQFVLEAGTEIGIGGIILIAESARWIALRGFCARILGWTSDRTSVVDEMLRSIRLAAHMRVPLLLGGESDLVPVAHSLHRYTHGDQRPFVLCDPRRVDVEESVRAVTNYELGLVAIEAARGGTLCVRGERPPSDYADVLRQIREPDERVQLIACSKIRGSVPVGANAPIWVPPLKRRAKEVPRIVDEYVHDAVTTLEAPRPTLTRSDRSWIIDQAANTLPEIEKAALRLVALRVSGNIAGAAARLRMAPISLARWIDRRRPPMRGRPGVDQ